MEALARLDGAALVDEVLLFDGFEAAVACSSSRPSGADPSVVTENTLFTGDEQKEIARRLEQAAKYMRETHSLSMAQMRALDEKVYYVIEASTRLGRKDWLNIFIATILGYVFIAALPPESVRTIFSTFLRSIGILYPELPLLEQRD